MQICPTHWEALKKGVDDLGLTHLIRKDNEELQAYLKAKEEGRAVVPDPLLCLNNGIWAEAMRVFGLSLLVPDKEGHKACPVCEAKKQLAQDWVALPLGGLKLYFQEEGWLPRDS